MTNDPTELMDPIIGETARALKEMKGMNDLDQRRVQSEIVLNLCRSLGVFFDLANEMMINGDLSEFPFEEED